MTVALAYATGATWAPSTIVLAVILGALTLLLVSALLFVIEGPPRVTKPELPSARVHRS